MQVRDPSHPQEVSVSSVPVAGLLATLQGSLSTRVKAAKSKLFWNGVLWWVGLIVVIAWSLLNLEVPFVGAMFVALFYYISRGLRCCQPRGADVATYIVDGPKVSTFPSPPARRPHPGPIELKLPPLFPKPFFTGRMLRPKSIESL